MTDNTNKRWGIADFLAGLGLGGLSGLLVGMTTASVTATVLSSVLAIATAFVGLAGNAKVLNGFISPIRLIGFSFSMIIALLAGVWMRTHETLAPTPQQLFDQLQPVASQAGPAADLVAFIKYGLIPKDREIAKSGERNDRINGTLFADVPSWCDDFRRRQGLSADEKIEWLEGQGDSYRELAQKMKLLSPDRQAEIARSALFYICGVDG